MDTVGVVIAIPGLINDCLDLYERFNKYKDSSTTASTANTIHAAQKYRLNAWAKAVGIGDEKNLDDRLHDPDLCSLVTEILQDLKHIFEQHDSKITSYAVSKATTGGQRKQSKRAAFRWAASDSNRVLSIVDQIEALVSVLYELVPLDRSDQATNKFDSRQDYLQQLLKAHADAAQQRNRQTADEYLHAPPTQSDYRQHAATRASGTCEWILSHPVYNGWRAPDTRPGLLWLSGPAGHGKSMLCARLLMELADDDDIHLAFCMLAATTSSQTTDLGVILRVFLSQLVRRNDGAMIIVLEQVQSSTHQVASSTEVWDMFTRVAEQILSLVLVIDGLDEFTANTGARTAFLEQLQQVLAMTATKVLVVSRREADIEATITKLGSDLSLFECRLGQDLLWDDLKLYASSMVDDRLLKHSQEFRNEVADGLVEQCDSMFLWIKLQQDQLRSGKSKKELRKVVRETPKSLDKAYERNVMQIRQLPDSELRRAMAILRFVLYAARALTVAELAEALLVSSQPYDDEDSGDESPLHGDNYPEVIDQQFVQEELVGLCASLIETRRADSEHEHPFDIGTSTIRLVHDTVRRPLELLLQEMAVPYVGATTCVEAAMAIDCVKYLRILARRPSDADVPEYWRRSPFRLYAEWYFDWHIGRSTEDSLVATQIVSEYLIEFGRELFSRILAEDLEKHMQSIQWDCQDAGSRPVIIDTPLSIACFLHLPRVVQQLHMMQSTDVSLAECVAAATLQWAFHKEQTVACLEMLVSIEPDIPLQAWERALALAVYDENVEVVNFITRQAPEVTPRRGCGHIVLPDPQSQMIDLLVFRLVNEVDCRGHGILHVCACGDNLPMLRRLAEIGANMSFKGPGGLSVLHTAVLSRASSTTIEWLLQQLTPDQRDDRQLTPLHYAIDRDMVDIVELLIHSGADINARAVDGNQPFHFAVAGHGTIAAILADKGLDITVVNDNGGAPIHLAAIFNDCDSIAMLLSRKVDVDMMIAGQSITPLYLAAEAGSLEAVTLLLVNGANPDSTTDVGHTAICVAAASRHISVVRLLLDHIHNIDLPGANKRSPLGEAILAGDVAITALLLARGADIHSSFPDNSHPQRTSSPIIMAISHKHNEVLELLLKFLSPNAPDTLGHTPLFVAAQYSNADAVRLLFAHGASPGSNDMCGRIITCAWDNLGRHHDTVTIINYLLEKGLDFHTPNRHGWSVPTVPKDFELNLPQLFINLGYICSQMRRNDTLSEIMAWKDYIPLEWESWVTNVLLAVAVIKNRTNWARALLADSADLSQLDHYGDTRMYDACHSVHDTEILDVLRAHGLKLNDFGHPRDTKPRTLQQMHSEGRMTQCTFDWLMKILSEEEDELRESDPQLLEDLQALRDIPEPREFALKRAITDMVEETAA